MRPPGFRRHPEAAAVVLKKLAGLRASGSTVGRTREAAGWQIGSGHVEAARKSVVNERSKRSGMRWGEDGADAVCHLRALIKGNADPWESPWAPSIN